MAERSEGGWSVAVEATVRPMGQKPFPCTIVMRREEQDQATAESYARVEYVEKMPYAADLNTVHVVKTVALPRQRVLRPI